MELTMNNRVVILLSYSSLSLPLKDMNMFLLKKIIFTTVHIIFSVTFQPFATAHG
jgi:hypothetical protein